MSEEVLNILAIGIEIGVPFVILIISVLNNSFRKYGVVILGACSVWLAFYLVIVLEHWFGSPETTFSYYAVWIMTFRMFMVTVATMGLISILLSKLPNNWLRFVSGSLSTLLLIGGMIYWRI